jgi:glycosyltransferase involved in cell wall biosynthesis
VASPVGINGVIVEPGVSGFLAADHDEWVAALRQLRDAAVAAPMGRSGRARIERDFSARVVTPRLAELLREAARSSR